MEIFHYSIIAKKPPAWLPICRSKFSLFSFSFIICKDIGISRYCSGYYPSLIFNVFIRDNRYCSANHCGFVEMRDNKYSMLKKSNHHLCHLIGNTCMCIPQHGVWLISGLITPRDSQSVACGLKTYTFVATIAVLNFMAGILQFSHSPKPAVFQKFDDEDRSVLLFMRPFT